MPSGTTARQTQWLRSLSTVLVWFGVGFLGESPGRAEIVTVDYGATDLPTLSETEQSTLDTLLGTQYPLVLSEISPDGKTVVVASAGRFSQDVWKVQFLDLETGELIDSPALEYEVISPDLPIRWLDNDVIRFVQQSLFGPWEIITINRKTQIVSHTTVYPTEAEEGEILGISPDFSKFVVQVFGEEEDIVYLVFVPSLDRMEVARLPEGFELRPPSWSESGDQVALVTTSEEERKLFDRSPFSPNLSNPVMQDALGRISPEENPFRQRNEIRIYDFTQETPLQFELKATDEERDFFAQAALSPNGKTLLVKMAQPSHLEGREFPSYLFPSAAYYRFYDLQGNLLQTLEDRILSGPTESIGEFIDEDTVLFLSASGIDRHFHQYDLPNPGLRSLPLPSGAVDPTNWQVTPDGQVLIYTFSSVTQPPELFQVALDGTTEPTQLTTINQAVADANQVQIQPVNFSTRNGDRPGFLVQPAGTAFPPQAAPIVFWQQGGPGLPMVNEFGVEVEMPLNLLPNFGISVLSVPLAGREGFGPEHYALQANGDNFGRVDMFEGADIVAQLIQRGWTTGGQIGVSGCSYGGYYASQMMARFPNLFAAANPQCSLLDTLTEWQLGFSSLLSYLVGRTPMEAPTIYQQMSPLYNADRIRTPTMMFHGADDFLQIDMARNFHDVIEENGTPVTLYMFEGIGHSLYDSEYQRIAAQLQVDFFRHHLARP